MDVPFEARLNGYFSIRQMTEGEDAYRSHKRMIWHLKNNSVKAKHADMALTLHTIE